MTKQEAARILRTEHLGDSERMELAKQMGARALDVQPLHFVMPVCENCRRIIPDVEIKHLCSHFNVAMMTNISPAVCPHCGAYFAQVDIDCVEQTVILKEARETNR